jgi:hypothetical protein
MLIPKRLKRQAGRHSLVDGVPFQLPVASQKSPALMAAFPIDADRAAELLPGNELHVLRWGSTGFLIVTVIDYRHTNIGKYVEYSIGIGCTRGPRPWSLPLAALFGKRSGLGQYVIDLPVSSEVSVKGGKGIWGMPKHQANLDFVIGEKTVSSRYDLDGQMVIKVEVERTKRENFPVRASAVNWCAFRGMLMKSDIYVKARAGFSLYKEGSARVILGDHPRAEPLRRLEIGSRPLFCAYMPESNGTLDDHVESWFLSYDEPPAAAPEGMESVVDLGLSEDWLPPPGSEEAAEQARRKRKVNLGAAQEIVGEPEEARNS